MNDCAVLCLLSQPQPRHPLTLHACAFPFSWTHFSPWDGSSLPPASSIPTCLAPRWAMPIGIQASSLANSAVTVNQPDHPPSGPAERRARPSRPGWRRRVTGSQGLIQDTPSFPCLVPGGWARPEWGCCTEEPGRAESSRGPGCRCSEPGRWRVWRRERGEGYGQCPRSDAPCLRAFCHHHCSCEPPHCGEGHRGGVVCE